MDIKKHAFQQKEQIVQREIGGETLLIPINQTGVDLQKVFVLNETALRVWQMIQSPRTVKGLVASLQDEFEGEAEEIQAHLIELIQDFSELGLIEVRTEG
mgnify:FL=1